MHKLRGVLLSVLIAPALITGCSSSSDDDDDGNSGAVPVVTPNDGSISAINGASITDDAVSLVDITALQSELDALSGGSRNAEPIPVIEGDTVASILARARSAQ